MGTHASERGGMAIATDRKDMGRCEMDGTNGMVHTSDISKRDEEIRSRDFYLEMSTPGAVSAKVGPSRPSGMVGEEARGLDGGDGGSPKSDATPSKLACLPTPRERMGTKSQDDMGSGPDHVGLAQVKLKRDNTESSRSSGSSSVWSELANELVKGFKEKLEKCIGAHRAERETGRPCRDQSVAPQLGQGSAAAPHPHGRIRNPYYENYEGMAREERPQERQLGREPVDRHMVLVGLIHFLTST